MVQLLRIAFQRTVEGIYDGLLRQSFAQRLPLNIVKQDLASYFTFRRIFSKQSRLSIDVTASSSQVQLTGSQLPALNILIVAALLRAKAVRGFKFGFCQSESRV